MPWAHSSEQPHPAFQRLYTCSCLLLELIYVSRRWGYFLLWYPSSFFIGKATCNKAACKHSHFICHVESCTFTWIAKEYVGKLRTWKHALQRTRTLVLRLTFKQEAHPWEEDWTHNQIQKCVLVSVLLSEDYETRCVLSDGHISGQRTSYMKY